MPAAFLPSALPAQDESVSSANQPHRFPQGFLWGSATAAYQVAWKMKEIYITENGASAIDTLTPEGKLFGVGSVMYLRNYLTHLQRAVAEGVPVRGYFLWSFLGNYECSDGYQRRFGIH